MEGDPLPVGVAAICIAAGWWLSIEWFVRDFGPTPPFRSEAQQVRRTKVACKWIAALGVALVVAGLITRAQLPICNSSRADTGQSVARVAPAKETVMPLSSGLSHVAMSVPEGTLTDEFRTRLLDFYGRRLAWHEIEALRRPDRLTVAVGAASYINVREQPVSMVSYGYEHFGVLLGSPGDLQQLWDDLADEEADVELEPLSPNERGEGSFRFRFLPPMAVEAQFYARLF